MFIIDLCGSIFVSRRDESAFSQIFWGHAFILFWKLNIVHIIVCNIVLGISKTPNIWDTTLALS